MLTVEQGRKFAKVRAKPQSDPNPIKESTQHRLATGRRKADTFDSDTDSDFGTV